MSSKSLVVSEALPDKVFTLSNILSEQECKDLITLTEQRGYKHATISVGKQAVQNSDVRNNDSVIIDDKKLAVMLWDRVKDKIPQVFSIWEDETVPVGLSDHFRFYRYESGQRFSRHYDGYEYGSMLYTNPGKSGDAGQPRLTFLVYLNNDFEGGNTTFFNSKGKELLAVPPTSGSGLIYTQKLLHEGSVVASGKKYVLRSDVLYGKVQAPPTGPNWEYCSLQ